MYTVITKREYANFKNLEAELALKESRIKQLESLLEEEKKKKTGRRGRRSGIRVDDTPLNRRKFNLCTQTVAEMLHLPSTREISWVIKRRYIPYLYSGDAGRRTYIRESDLPKLVDGINYVIEGLTIQK